MSEDRIYDEAMSAASATGMWVVETVRPNPMHTRLMVGRQQG